MGLPRCRLYEATRMSPLWGYPDAAPIGLPRCRPDGAKRMSPLQGWDMRFRPDGAICMKRSETPLNLES